MGFRWLVNASLLVIPVGTTIGILLGVDSHRQASGQKPLFNGDGGSGSGGGYDGGGGSSTDNGITNAQYCQKQVGISPESKGSRYISKQTWPHPNTTHHLHGGPILMPVDGNVD